MNKIFASILNFFNDITGHYLIALLLVALLVKLEKQISEAMDELEKLF